MSAEAKSEPLLPSPSEREELASVISHAINFDDGAHHLSMGDDGEPCRACQDVADAVIFAGYSKRSSPASSEPTAVEQSITTRMLAAFRHRQSMPCERCSVDGWATAQLAYCDACLTLALDATLRVRDEPASPSSAGQEVREAVREALSKLANLYDGAALAPILRAWRDEQYPALSAGETETRT